MAIFHHISESRYTLDGVIKYIASGARHSGKVALYGGFYVNPYYASRDMQLFKKICSKEGGSQYKHFVLSLDTDELPDCRNWKKYDYIPLSGPWEPFQEIAAAIQKLTQCQMVFAVHANTSHLHMHMIINSVRMDTGMKLNIDYPLFITMLNICDETLNKYNVGRIHTYKGFIRGADDLMQNGDDTSDDWWWN
ncbi:MAG: relaxase/mobilization nuclease domain-containing protein [Acidaminococcaceae bacterium]|nr:relaxase/mobilization nuclease domain-containing protein [Acidaminococcaceae bacterium]